MLSFGVVTVLMMVISVVGHYGMQRIADQTRKVETMFPVLDAAMEVKIGEVRAMALMMEVLAAPTSESLVEMKKERAVNDTIQKQKEFNQVRVQMVAGLDRLYLG